MIRVLSVSRSALVRLAASCSASRQRGRAFMVTTPGTASRCAAPWPTSAGAHHGRVRPTVWPVGASPGPRGAAVGRDPCRQPTDRREHDGYTRVTCEALTRRSEQDVAALRL